jgi:DNA-binding GntR family transcriptional regulator
VALSAQLAARLRDEILSGLLPPGGELDFTFHRVLVDAAGSERLSRTCATVQAETRMCLHRLMGGYRNSEALAEAHYQLAALVGDAGLEENLIALTAHFGDPIPISRKAHGAGGRLSDRGTRAPHS